MRNFSRIINIVLHRVGGRGHILLNPESQPGFPRGGALEIELEEWAGSKQEPYSGAS